MPRAKKTKAPQTSSSPDQDETAGIGRVRVDFDAPVGGVVKAGSRQTQEEDVPRTDLQGPEVFAALIQKDPEARPSPQPRSPGARANTKPVVNFKRFKKSIIKSPGQLLAYASKPYLADEVAADEEFLREERRLCAERQAGDRLFGEDLVAEKPRKEAARGAGAGGAKQPAKRQRR